MINKILWVIVFGLATWALIHLLGGLIGLIIMFAIILVLLAYFEDKKISQGKPINSYRSNANPGIYCDSNNSDGGGNGDCGGGGGNGGGCGGGGGGCGGGGC